MQPAIALARQILSAALLLCPIVAHAEIAARYDPPSGAVIVTGLQTSDVGMLLDDPTLIRLQNTQTPAASGMLVSLVRAEEGLRIAPRFPLRTGARYTVSIAWPHSEPFRSEFALDAPSATVPSLVGFAPSQAEIPANTLRLYLTFSEPMARGQVRDAIVLVGENGDPVASPFLNLETELWDKAQTRLTLILDPGRIKQGVGPNTRFGAPLLDGERYRLVVSDEMRSSAGAALGSERSVAFQVGPAERRKIDPDAWEVIAPKAGALAPFSVAFDRIMDTGAARRLLRLVGPDGAPVDGQVHTDGGGWSLTPSVPWIAGPYHLVADPQLEDVAGNTIRAAFDAEAGTMGASVPPASIEFRIRQN